MVAPCLSPSGTQGTHLRKLRKYQCTQTGCICRPHTIGTRKRETQAASSRNDLVQGVGHAEISRSIWRLGRNTKLNSPSGSRLLFILGTTVLQVHALRAPAGSVFQVKHDEESGQSQKLITKDVEGRLDLKHLSLGSGLCVAQYLHVCNVQIRTLTIV